jgi:hypothetical protein
VALRVEVCKDGKVIAESRVAWSANAQRYDFSPWSSIYGWNDDKDVAWLPLTGDNAALAGADFSQPGWTLRVRSDPELALSDPTVTRYWSGEFVVPLVREP